MTDPYRILGVTRASTDKQIKDAYRKLTMVHHPDKGGDNAKFLEITQAYNAIKTKQDRSQYDSPGEDAFSQGGFNTRADFNDFSNAFRMHFGQRQTVTKNRDIHINYNITLEEVLDGVNKDVRITLPNNQHNTVNIKIPQGIRHGDKIKFAGCGDNTHSGFASGDLYVTILEQRHPQYSRLDNNCIVTQSIDVYTAMVGGELAVKSIDGSRYKILIKPGTQSGTRLRIPEAGFPIINTSRTGDLIVTVDIKIPAVTDTSIKIQDLKEEN